MDSALGKFIYLLFGVGLISYMVYFRSLIEKKRNNAIFDERALGFIDGLYLMDVHFRCSCSEMRRYVEEQLAKAHALPGNKALIEYTTSSGWRYYSRTGTGDHTLFAILCIVQYAQERGDSELISWCESVIESARKNGINYRTY